MPHAGVSKTLEAVYENGVFRPLETPDLPDAQRVRLQVELITQGGTGRRRGTAGSLAQSFAEMEAGGGIDDEEWARFEAELKRVDLEDTERTRKSIEQALAHQDA